MSAKRLTTNQLDELFAETISSVPESILDNSWEPVPLGNELPDAAEYAPSDSNGQRSYVTFRLGKQIYAIPIEPIRQIVEMVTITPLPQLDELITGVINVRENAVPVINMRRHFALPPAPPNLDPHILLVQLGRWTVGLVVDQVIDVMVLNSQQIISIPEILPQALGELPILGGLANTFDQTVLLLNLDFLFVPYQRSKLAQALAMVSEEESEEE